MEHQQDNAFPVDRYQYVLGGLAAAIPHEQSMFVPLVDGTDMGFLKIAHGTLPTLDGQHRRYGVQLAIQDLARLGRESVTVTFYLTSEEEQQSIFSVLNRYTSAYSGDLFCKRHHERLLTPPDESGKVILTGLEVGLELVPISLSKRLTDPALGTPICAFRRPRDSTQSRINYRHGGEPVQFTWRTSRCKSSMSDVPELMCIKRRS